MSSPFVAEIRIFGFNYAPTGWAFCDGQLLPISQNTALFSLLGTFYGGDGKSNFALPDLQGNAPLFWGQGPGLSLYDLGETGGTPTVTLISSEIPSHTHSLKLSTDTGTSTDPANKLPAAPNINARFPRKAYAAPGGATVNMNPGDVVPSGNEQPHNNLMPSLVLNFCIALQGVFPPRT